jgi:HAD superfamily hydrolase (TIGR01509 family)
VGRVAIRGVLFDFSGTLFRLEVPDSALPSPALAERFLVVRGLTGAMGPAPVIPPDLADDWARRDLSPELHRRAHVGAIRNGGITEPGLAEEFYQLLLEPASWKPYPDTKAALELLRERGIPVAVVSNIGFDIRPAFELAGVAELVDTFVLSYLEGSMKPAEKLFRVAAERLGVDPAETLMIGDNAEADGGAAAVGAAVAIVPPNPTTERPDALLTALAEHGLG